MPFFLKMSRIIHCGCCGIAGHNVRHCVDVYAHNSNNRLLEESDLTTALIMCETMSLQHILFILSKNNIAIGSSRNINVKRQQLKQFVRDRFATQPVSESDRFERAIYAFETTDVDSYIQVSPNNFLHSLCNSHDNISSNTVAFKYITMTYAKIMLHSLYKFAARETTNQIAFDYVVSMRLSHSMFIRTSLNAQLGIVFSESTIALIINKARLANCNIHPLHSDISQMIYPTYSNDSFEATPFIPATMLTFIGIDQYIANYIHGRQQQQQQQQEPMKPLNVSVTVCANMNIALDSKCSVCWEDDIKVDQLVSTGCNHVFCIECIKGVAHTRDIKSFIKCPCCRDEISVLRVPDNATLDEINNALAPI